MRKDKEKVLDEVWTEERIRRFLELNPVEGVNGDFHMLMRAYQSMKHEDFTKFVGFFCSEKRNINAQNPLGETVLSIVNQHRHGEPYVKVLKEAGAN